MSKEKDSALCLVTGVTGYIGGRLVPWLLDKGYRVRALTRDRDRLQGRGWMDYVEVVEADVLYPFHSFIFSSMIEHVATDAQKQSSATVVSTLN